METRNSPNSNLDPRSSSLAPLLLRHTGAAVYIVDASEKLMHVNPELARLLGMPSPASMRLEAYLEFVYPDADARIEALGIHREVMRAGSSSRQFEQVLTGWDGSRHLVRWLLCRVEGAGQARLVAIGRDGTSVWKLERWVRMLSQLLGWVDEAIVVTDFSGGILYWGGGAEALLGGSAPRRLDRNFGSLFHGPTGEQRAQELLAAARKGGAEDSICELSRLDGGLCRCRIRSEAVRDLNGDSIALAFLLAEERELPQGEEERAPATGRSPLEESLARSGLVAAINTDETGHVRTWNRAAERLGGRSAGRALGQVAVDEVLDLEDMSWSSLASQLSARGRLQQKVQVNRPNRTVAQASLEALALRDERGEFGGALLLLEDLTQRTSLDDELLFSKQAMLTATLTEGMVARVESVLVCLDPDRHQLLGQLRKLRKLSELAAEDGEALRTELEALDLASLEKEYQEVGFELGEAVQLLRQLVGDLRHFLDASTEAPRSVHLGRVLRAALSLVEHRLTGRCQVRMELGALPAVRAMRGPMLRAFCLMLLAAADSCGRSPSENIVRVTGTSQEGWVNLEVAEDGEGFGVDVRSRLSDLVYLATRPGIGPLMLGLCRQEIRTAGGSLDLSGAPGAGTHFRFAFPAANASVALHAMAPQALYGAGTAGPVLVLEEDDLLRRALERHLSTSFRTVSADAAVDVLEQVKEGRFAAAVVGFSRPEGYGIRVVQRLAEANRMLWRNSVLLVPPGLRRTTRERLQSSGAVLLPRSVDTVSLSTVLARMLSELG